MQESAPDWRRAVRHLRASDARLAAIIEQIGPCRLSAGATGFGGLARSIVAQQLAGSAFRAIHSRLQALFDGGDITAEGFDGLSEETLRATGLSRRKIEYIRELARRVLEGGLSFDELHRLDDEALIEALTRIRGIGRWTAEMYLLALSRPDVFPIGDLGIRTAMRQVYGLGKDELEARAGDIAEMWRPYRSVACWYLYTYLNRSRER